LNATVTMKKEGGICGGAVIKKGWQNTRHSQGEGLVLERLAGEGGTSRKGFNEKP